MKKLLSILLALTMLLSLAACGKTTDTPNTEPNKEQVETPTDIETPSDEENTELSKEIEWEVRADVTLDIPVFELETVNYNGSTDTFELVKDPYGLSMDSAREFFAGNYDIVENSWNEYISISEDEIDSDWIYGHDFNVTEYLAFVSKEGKPSVVVQTDIDTTMSMAATEFKLTFYDIETNLESQKEIFEITKGLLGESWATYLTYAKDSDGRDIYDGELEGKFEIKDLVNIGDYALSCYRYIDENSVTFWVQMNREGFNYCTIYSGDYVSKYDETYKYKLQNIFPAISVDYLNHDNAYSEFFALHNADKLPNSMMEKVSIDYTEYDDHNSYYIDMDSVMYDVGDVSVEGDTFTVMLNISEDLEGNITDVVIRAYGDERLPGYEDMTEQEIMEALKPVISQKIQYLLPGIELFADKWEVGEMKTFESTHRIEGLDVELDYLLDITINPEGDFSWNVQLTYDCED